MAYDEALAQRVREALRGEAGITEKKMFGGIAFLQAGHMFVGVAGDSLMARVGPANYDAALRTKGVREMDFTGKPMRGYVFVDTEGLRAPGQVRRWVRQCAEFAATLPPKAKRAA
jgi:TfoX/Sxy family transcriptional regulator of competence genes